MSRSAAWEIGWRAALTTLFGAALLYFGWWFPEGLTLSAFISFPIAVLALGRLFQWLPHWRWYVATLVVIAAIGAAQWTSNWIASAGLVSLRVRLLEHHARTGEYPTSLDELAAADPTALPAAGLPGTSRQYYYGVGRRPSGESISPVLLYVFAVPFGRCGIHFDDGRVFCGD